jgi:hypothetical protein
MTTLAIFTFDSGTNIGGVIVRGYATGRYLNNSGSTQSPLLTVALNTVTIASIAVPTPTSTGAVGWIFDTHVYFTKPVVEAGNVPSVGCTLRANFTNPGTASNETGSYVLIAPMQVWSLPFSTYVLTSQANVVTTTFVPAGVSNETLEIGCAYLEGL